jgi:hypothetical protein
MDIAHIVPDAITILMSALGLAAALVKMRTSRQENARLRGRIDELQGAETMARLAAAERERAKLEWAEMRGRFQALQDEMRDAKRALGWRGELDDESRLRALALDMTVGRIRSGIDECDRQLEQRNGSG